MSSISICFDRDSSALVHFSGDTLLFGLKGMIDRFDIKQVDLISIDLIDRIK